MIVIRVLSGIVATALAAASIPLAVVGFGLGSFASDGTTTLPTIAVSTSERALEFGEIDIRSGLGADEHDRWVAGRIDDVTIEADGSSLFLGVGPSTQVERFVATGSDPLSQEFWIVQSTGDDPRVELRLPDGAWSGVVMNADGTAGVDTDLSVTIPSAPVRLAAGLVLGAGVVTAGIAALLFVVAFRRQTPSDPEPVRASTPV